MAKTTEQFIIDAKAIHGGRYDYSLVNYITAHTDVLIICHEHGVFKQRPNAHTGQKQGCPICGLANRKVPHKKTTGKFIQQAKDKWGDRYDYTITEYTRKDIKLKYTCHKHGVIEQYPPLHLKSGCPFCNGRGISRHSKESFVLVAHKVHDNKYDYSHTDFRRMSDDILIVCPKHGEFQQRAGNHIHLGNGCPKCVSPVSKGEVELAAFIKNLSPNVLTNERILDGKEIDIYLPDQGLGFEYNGIYWHLEMSLGRKYHYNKWKSAKEKNIQLIQILDLEWLNKQDIVKSKIVNLLGKSKKVFARNTAITELNQHDKDEFLTKNHLQGSDASKITYGLIYQGDIVACMTFGPSRFNRKYDHEMVRFCSKTYTSVVGGASRLLNHFRKHHQGSIVTYADKRYSSGNLYGKIGFVLDGETAPSFSYFNLKSNTLHSRLSYRRKHMIAMPYYSDDLTAYEIMQLNGFDRIWDAGQYRFVIGNN